MSEEVNENIVPALRFPEFGGKGKWGIEELGRKTKKIGSGITPKGGDKNYKSEGNPFVRSQNVGWGKLILEDVVYIDEETHSTFSATEIKIGDVFLNITGASIGRSAIANKKVEGGNVNQHVCIIRVKDKELDAKYLNQFLISDTGQKQIDSFQAGGNRQGLNFGQIRSFLIPCPLTITEQQKIADCLFSIDELITAQNKKLEALQSHKKGLIQKLFPAGSTTIPECRFPEFQASEEWRKCSLQDLIDEDVLLPPKDGNHGNIHPKASDYVQAGIPFIMASNIQNGKIDLISCSKISKEQADSLQKGFTKSGDVLLTHKGTVGETALVENIKYPYLMLTPQVTYYRIKNKDKLLNQFLLHLFASEQFQHKLSKASGGGTRAYIGITEQRKLGITTPVELSEQRKIADCLSSLDKMITTQSQKIESLKFHKKGLMQQLFPDVEGVHQ